jgi:hypothetical protein
LNDLGGLWLGREWRVESGEWRVEGDRLTPAGGRGKMGR